MTNIKSKKLNLAAKLVKTSGILALILAVALVLSASVGAVNFSPALVLKVVINHLFGWTGLHQFSVGQIDDHIIWQIHIPRMLLGALVGMSLAIAGTALQGLLLNPLADPYMIGVSSGAAVGAGVAVLLGLAAAFVPLFAFISAILAVSVVYALARRGDNVSILSFVLAGVVVGSFTWAALTFILTIAPNQTLEKIVFWTMGSLAGSEPWSRVALLTPFTVLCSLLLYAFGRDLNVFALGEESAKYLGLSVESLKRIIIVITTMLTAAAVSVSGTIGFIGLMVPHIARRIVGPDNRLLIPAAGLLGAIL
ncbi:MAG TPA: iron chelate uptake ABC transporter family permease subunit, partial [Armatimonadota bacterium]